MKLSIILGLLICEDWVIKSHYMLEYLYATNYLMLQRLLDILYKYSINQQVITVMPLYLVYPIKV